MHPKFRYGFDFTAGEEMLGESHALVVRQREQPEGARETALQSIAAPSTTGTRDGTSGISWQKGSDR